MILHSHHGFAYFHRNNCEDPRKHEFFKSINFPRLEAGLTEPPWVPKPNVVYAKDTGDIAEFSEIKGIVFDDKDNKFFKEFSTGAVAISWQQEQIATGLFDELNDPNRKESAAGLDDEKKSGTCALLWGGRVVDISPYQPQINSTLLSLTNNNERSIQSMHD